jgi:hypothetical protein
VVYDKFKLTSRVMSLQGRPHVHCVVLILMDIVRLGQSITSSSSWILDPSFVGADESFADELLDWLLCAWFITMPRGGEDNVEMG